MSETKETVIRPDGNGAIHIAEDVVASVAALAAVEAEGVSALSAGAGMDISELLGKKNLAKGVRINIEDGAVTTDIFLLVKYGYAITTVAAKVQESVKSAIESMTGLTSATVNIHVTGVSFGKGKSEK